MSNVLNVCLLLSLIFIGNKPVQQATLIFISLQVVLAYFVSGLAKLRSKTWLQGEAIYKTLNTLTFGSPGTGKFMYKLGNPVNLAICWGISLWQVSFVFAFMLPDPLFYAYMIAGVAFHLLNAWILG